jgi:hypothetical protein
MDPTKKPGCVKYTPNRYLRSWLLMAPAIPIIWRRPDILCASLTAAEENRPLVLSKAIAV